MLRKATEGFCCPKVTIPVISILLLTKLYDIQSKNRIFIIASKPSEKEYEEL